MKKKNDDKNDKNDPKKFPVKYDKKNFSSDYLNMELFEALGKTKKTISRSELFYIMRTREQFQNMRCRGGQIIHTATGSKQIVKLIAQTSAFYEDVITEFLNKRLIERDPVSHKWATKIIGIGPVHALTLSSLIDMDTTESVSRIWRFAGMTTDTPKPKKGEKLSFCRKLKSTAYLIGQQFKFHNKDLASFYGAAYNGKKIEYQLKNQAGAYKEAAARALEEKSYKKTTVAYKHYIKGLLPDGHVDARAIRWVAKLFLSHWFEVAYFEVHGRKARDPWIATRKILPGNIPKVYDHRIHDISSAWDVLEFEQDMRKIHPPPSRKKKGDAAA